MTRNLFFVSLALCLFLISAPSFAASLLALNHTTEHAGTTWFVASNGVDSAECGATKKDPCRSISAAISNAIDGDTIKVGPGRYGDLNGDGLFTEPGEEAAEIDFGCFCAIHVDKSVTLISAKGPSVTVLDGAGAQEVIRVTADSAVVGGNKNGFTVTQGRFGLVVREASQVEIVGNVALNMPSIGFAVFLGTNNLFVKNTAYDCRDGFFGAGNAAGNTFRSNVANSNRGPGFRMASGNELQGNTAIGNGSHGIRIDSGQGHVIQDNSVIANNGAGIFLEGNPITAMINSNNIFANAGADSLNCGIFSRASLGGVLDPPYIDATTNFWGAATGPGPDPADDAGPGSGCGVTADLLIVEPFATKPFRIHARSRRQHLR